ncbi:hypothetical protein [Micromonospora sp. RP3T]|uniref:hypothetical protein n=1 Tax=Micromonospora sp. RP3T TaxID=2135446 RepID=UPI003D74E51A
MAADKAIKVVRRLPKLAAAGVKLRLLRILAVYQMPLWLHSATEDLLVSLKRSVIDKEGKAMPATSPSRTCPSWQGTMSFRAEPN